MRILKCNVEITTGIEVYTNAGKKKNISEGTSGKCKTVLMGSS